MAGRPRLRAATVRPSTLPLMPQAGVSAAIPTGLPAAANPGAWGTLPDDQRAILGQAFDAFQPPAPPAMDPGNQMPQGFLESLAATLGPNPFQIPQGNFSGGPGAYFLTGLASGFGNALSNRGAMSYRNRVAQQQAQQAQAKATYDARVKAAQAGQQDVVRRAINLVGTRPASTDPVVKPSRESLQPFVDSGRILPAAADDIAANGIPQSKWDTLRMSPAPKKAATGGGLNSTQTINQQTAGDLAEGVYRGDLPVTSVLPTSGRASDAQLKAQALLYKKYGFNVKDAYADQVATMKHLSSANSPSIFRLTSALDNTAHSLDLLDDLNKELASRVPRQQIQSLNRVSLSAALNGAYGQPAAEIAQKYIAIVPDISSELGQIYMGGNTPTDHSIKIAQANFNKGMTFGQVQAMTNLTRKTIAIRRNSINNAGVVRSTGAESNAHPLDKFVR